MNRLLRIFKHRWLDTEDAHRALGAGTLERLRERVRDSEARHTGEIRICVEAGLPMSYLWRNASARERAVTMFGKLGVWDTEHNNGVLIYLLVADHAIELVADRAIHRHVDPQTWQSIVQGMSAAFKGERYEEGLNAAVDEITRLLVQHFPAAPGEVNPNELPDWPHVR